VGFGGVGGVGGGGRVSRRVAFVSQYAYVCAETDAQAPRRVSAGHDFRRQTLSLWNLSDAPHKLMSRTRFIAAVISSGDVSWATAETEAS